MKTSNFARAANNPNAIAISRGLPSWYNGPRFIVLAPSWALQRITDEQLFTHRFTTEVLEKLDPHKIANALSPDAIMLCWEAPGEFCHRRLVAKWLETELGIEVPEMETEREQRASRQPSLFEE